MSRTALILAAHGSHDGSAANALMQDIAARLQPRVPQDTVVAAFNLGTPHYREIIDRLDATDITIVPVMTSDGYFRRVVLPREFAANTRAADVTVRITRAAGTQPAAAEIMAGLAAGAARQYRLRPHQFSVAVIGHGTRRHAQSRLAAHAVRDQVRAIVACAACEAFFLDEPPEVQDIPTHLPHDNILVVPFLLGGGFHALRDIPERLGVNIDSDDRPTDARNDNQRFIFTAALGDDPALLDILADLATVPAEDCIQLTPTEALA
jgi:sirohydrochlorin ferrochelatase